MKAARYVAGAVLLFAGAFPTAGEELPSGWERIDDCRLIRHRNNDGDSFHVRAGDRERIFRLYFVDTVEHHLTPENRERVIGQGHYFGIEDVETALKLSESAADFSAKALRKSFTVYTRWEVVGHEGRTQRYRAFVETRQGDLTRMLVAGGLARISRGSAVSDSPHGVRAESILKELEGLEREARSGKLGGWGMGRFARVRPAGPAGTAVSQTGALDPLDLDSVRARLGKTVTVEGVPVVAGSSRSGNVHYLNFARNYRQAISLVFFSGRAPGHWTREKLEPYVGRSLRATGEVSEYQGQIQIIIRSAEQLDTAAP